MFYAILHAMLGPLGPVLDWILANPAPVTIPLFIWTVIWFYSKVQFQKIEKQTTQLVLDIGRDAVALAPNVSARSIFRRVYPIWTSSLPKWARIIPHRLELWPIRASQDEVEKRLGFSPHWIKKVLADNGIEIRY